MQILRSKEIDSRLKIYYYEKYPKFSGKPGGILEFCLSGKVRTLILFNAATTCINRFVMSLFQVCAFNRTVEKVDHFLANEAKGTKIIGARSLEEMVSKLKKPRRVMLLVKAGSAVDAFIDKLVRAVNTSPLRPLC